MQFRRTAVTPVSGGRRGQTREVLEDAALTSSDLQDLLMIRLLSHPPAVGKALETLERYLLQNFRTGRRDVLTGKQK